MQQDPPNPTFCRFPDPYPLDLCRKALESLTARQMRLLFALNPWEKSLAYGTQMLTEMRAKETVLKSFFRLVDGQPKGASATHEVGFDAVYL